VAEHHHLRRLTRLVRERSPHALVMWLRAGIELWGSLTSPLRMRPSFIIVGAQRAGTTTLYRVLSEHPEVARPTVSKGIGYFDVKYARGPRWYRGHFPLAWRARRKHGPGAATFESSGYYVFHPLAAERIARDLPEVRVVLLVRDPVERAYSAYKHELARGFETESFEVALGLEEERLAGEVERMVADPGYQSFHHRHHGYLARGRYIEQLERLVKALGEDRVYVVDAGAFFENPGAEFERLRSWLGLAWWRPGKVEQWNARPSSPMPPELEQRLRAHFEPYDARLADHMGRTPSWRASARQD
jgi:hypothetical protein